MSSSKKSNDLGVPDSPPPTTPEEMEEHLISLAYKRAERQILDGTASPTTINYFLRLGGTRAEEELDKLRNENKLLQSRANALDSQENIEKLFGEAMKMFGVYSGLESVEEDGYDD